MAVLKSARCVARRNLVSNSRACAGSAISSARRQPFAPLQNRHVGLRGAPKLQLRQRPLEAAQPSAPKRARATARRDRRVRDRRQSRPRIPGESTRRSRRPAAPRRLRAPAQSSPHCAGLPGRPWYRPTTPCRGSASKDAVPRGVPRVPSATRLRLAGARRAARAGGCPTRREARSARSSNDRALRGRSPGPRDSRPGSERSCRAAGTRTSRGSAVCATTGWLAEHWSDSRRETAPPRRHWPVSGDRQNGCE